MSFEQQGEIIEHSSEQEDVNVRRVRFLKIGIRHNDQVALDAVKEDLVKEFGDYMGEGIFEKLYEIVSKMEIAKDSKK